MPFPPRLLVAALPVEVRRSFRWVEIALLSFLLTISAIPGAWGQFSLPKLSETAAPTNQLPPRVKRVGNLEITPIQFEGKDLFWIASAAVADRQNPQQQVPVEKRARQIEQNLNSIITIDSTRDFATEERQGYITLFDPKSLQVGIATLNGQTVLYAKDTKRSLPTGILTVTDTDASFHGVTVQELAQRWQETLQQKLQQALEERSPATMVENFLKAVKIGLITIAASLGLWLIKKAVDRQSNVLKTLLIQAESIDIPINKRRNLPWHQLQNYLQKHISLEELHQWKGAILWLLLWGQCILWLSGLIWVLGLFPHTYRWSILLTQTPVKLLALWWLTSLLNRLGDIAISRFVKLWESNKLFLIDDPHRHTLRLATQVRVFKGLKTSLIVGLGLLIALSTLGVAVYSLLAGGALVALVISFAAQNLVKDLLNGCLILWEDQFAIGDWVAVGNVSGLVENMNLRITQLRDSEGRLITIPNNLITQVTNFTRSWSQVNFKMRVPYNTDVEKALQILTEIGEQLYADPTWRPLILEPPQVLGIEHISYLGLTLRALIKTQPNQQWQVARQFRLRLRLAFEQQGIKIEPPQVGAWEGKRSAESSAPDAPQQYSALPPDQHEG